MYYILILCIISYYYLCGTYRKTKSTFCIVLQNLILFISRKVILPMDYYLSTLKKQLLLIKENAIKYSHVTNHDSLRVSSSNGSFQYYTTNNKSPSSRHYIKKEDVMLASELATRDYCKKLVLEIEKRLHLITSLEQHPEYMNLSSLHQIYESMPQARKLIVNPLTQSNEEIINDWYSNQKTGNNPFQITTNIFTERGEQVRSKTEKIIADTYFRRNIPYVYEPEFLSDGKILLCPDFALLNLRTRRTWYWEHFGLMSDPRYSESFCKKIDTYQKNGIYIGDGLIVTFESQNTCIDTRDINILIDKYLL